MTLLIDLLLLFKIEPYMLALIVGSGLDPMCVGSCEFNGIGLELWKVKNCNVSLNCDLC